MKSIFVAIYEHRHGADVDVFLDEQGAFAWRTRIAKEWWRREIDAAPPDDNAIGAAYFDHMADRGEYFSVHACTLPEVHTEVAAEAASRSFAAPTDFGVDLVVRIGAREVRAEIQRVLEVSSEPLLPLDAISDDDIRHGCKAVAIGLDLSAQERTALGIAADAAIRAALDRAKT